MGSICIGDADGSLMRLVVRISQGPVASTWLSGDGCGGGPSCRCTWRREEVVARVHVRVVTRVEARDSVVCFAARCATWSAPPERANVAMPHCFAHACV